MSNDTVLVLVVITAITHAKPSEADINRVRSHLAAGGWPLAGPPRD